MSDDSTPEMTPDIEEILFDLYSNLPEFEIWLDEKQKLSKIIIGCHLQNAEEYFDYIANEHQILFHHSTEFIVKWFVYSEYLRTTDTSEQEREILLSSLNLLNSFFKLKGKGIEDDWFIRVIEDDEYYQLRLTTYGSMEKLNEQEWKNAFDIWCVELNEMLDSKCLMVPNYIGDGMTWGNTMGWREKTLMDEANRMWQYFRTELIGQGMSFEEMRPKLEGAFTRWLAEPQEKLDGLSPSQMIGLERMEREEQEGGEPQEPDFEEDEWER